MLVTLQEATAAPQGYTVSVRGEWKKRMRGALPLNATNLVLSQYAEAVYNLSLRMSEVSVCADTPDTA
jgi:hypothetical protein